MRTGILLVLAAATAAAQWTPAIPSNYPVLDNWLSQRMAYQVGSGAPSTCAAGKEIDADLTGGVAYWCAATNTPVRIIDAAGLAAWIGSASVSMLGTITSGVWHGTPIDDAHVASAATWNAKQAAITTGTTAQYIRGDLSLATFPTLGTSATHPSTDFQPAGSYAAANAATTVNGQACALGSSCTVADSTKVPTSTQVNGHALSGNVTVTASDVGLGSVTNDAQTKAAIMPNTAPSPGQIPVGNSGGMAFAPVSMSGDASITNAGAVSVVKLQGRSVSSSAPSGGAVLQWVAADSAWEPVAIIRAGSAVSAGTSGVSISHDFGVTTFSCAITGIGSTPGRIGEVSCVKFTDHVMVYNSGAANLSFDYLLVRYL